jgi:hypothetical protein
MTGMQTHFATLVIAPKNAGECIAKFSDSAIENAVRSRNRVSRNNWIARIAPNKVLAAWRPVFPWKGCQIWNSP